MERHVSTHQRVYFDVTLDGCYLASGSDDGYIHIWDLKESPQNGILPRKKSFMAHANGANGAR